MVDLYSSDAKRPEAAVHNQPGHTHNPFSCFSYRPDNVSFDTQDDGEKIVLLLRAHPITNIPWILAACLLALAPSILTLAPFLSFLPGNFQFVVLLMWYLIVAAFVIESFLGWFFNIYIVTDERVVDIDFINLIYKEDSHANLEDVQEIKASVGGVVGTMFNFGNVSMQTAGAHPTIEFGNVGDPASVVKITRQLQEDRKKIV